VFLPFEEVRLGDEFHYAPSTQIESFLSRSWKVIDTDENKGDGKIFNKAQL